MSHAVTPADLAETAKPYGCTPFLLYSGSGGSARVNHVVVESITDGIVALRGFGRGIARRLQESPDTKLSLLWAAPSADSFSLIADGTGIVSDTGEEMTLTVSDAVLHRPAPVDGPPSC